MTVERAAALIVLILPAVVAFCAGVWKVFTWAVDRHDEAAVSSPPIESRIQQGEVINQPESWAERAAYESVRELLEDERADHAHTIDRHRPCHDVMREHGIPVPDDH
jgi:hypothetical protein